MKTDARSAVCCRRAVVIALLVSVAAGAEHAAAPSGRVIARSVTPYYTAIDDQALPAGYVDRGDTCAVESLVVSESGASWFALWLDTIRVWSPTGPWRYARQITEQVSGTRAREEEDRRRRLAILRRHRDWPRRILRAVREGRVCLDMTGTQLKAAWGTPLQTSDTFTLGIGRHQSWLYEGSDGRLLVVNLQDDRVIGWSVE
jgi:hypothetical protein